LPSLPNAPLQLDHAGQILSLADLSHLGVQATTSSRGDFSLVNQYNNAIDHTHWFTVQAGSLVSSPSQGVLVVWTNYPDAGVTLTATYPSPTADGALSLVSVSYPNVIADSANGAQFTFNIQTGMYG
jgi:hypothetical protein